jgi:hypothetical protein
MIILWKANESGVADRDRPSVIFIIFMKESFSYD